MEFLHQIDPYRYGQPFAGSGMLAPGVERVVEIEAHPVGQVIPSNLPGTAGPFRIYRAAHISADAERKGAILQIFVIGPAVAFCVGILAGQHQHKHHRQIFL